MKICSKLTLKGNALNVRGICGHIRTVDWLCTYVQYKHAMLITILALERCTELINLLCNLQSFFYR